MQYILLGFGLGALVACGPSTPLSNVELSRPLRVSAAISLSGPLQILTEDFQRQTGLPVELNLAGSSTLAAQIIAGALVDLYISADTLQMARVANEGILETNPPVVLLSNQLVIITPVGVAASFDTPEALTAPAVRRLALGDPSGVPAGVYAKRFLQSRGLWTALRRRVVPTRSVRAALVTVETAEADAGIVYRTDALSSTRVQVTYEVAVDDAPTISYPAAVVANAANAPAARRLLEFLQRPDSTVIFEQAGFIPPATAG